MSKLIVAHTPAAQPSGSNYPPYLNISWAGDFPHSTEPDDDDIVITVRSKRKEDGTEGDYAHIKIQRHDLERLILELAKEARWYEDWAQKIRWSFAARFAATFRRSDEQELRKKIIHAGTDPAYGEPALKVKNQVGYLMCSECKSLIEDNDDGQICRPCGGVNFRI